MFGLGLEIWLGYYMNPTIDLGKREKSDILKMNANGTWGNQWTLEYKCDFLMNSWNCIMYLYFKTTSEVRKWLLHDCLL